jgi:hypothetical protein
MDLIPACVGKINFKYLIEHNVFGLGEVAEPEVK